MNTGHTHYSHPFWSLLKMVLRLNRHGVYKYRDFHALLERERALADRHNRIFSLLEFHFTNGLSEAGDAQPLMDVLERRLRHSDIAGWIGPHRLGVILPDTSAAGAWALAGRVMDELPQRMARPACHVCTYPSSQPQMEAAARNEEAGSVLAAPAVYPPEPVDAMPDLVGLILFGAPPRWKRVIDVAGGCAALVLLSPLMAGVALTIKAVSKGPVLFRQERVGYLGKAFTCWKFRTMRVDADTQVHRQYFNKLMRTDVPMTKLDMKDDPRLIPLGRYLRASGVDELPQLFNVIRGEMSLVGPRPCIRYEYEGYQTWQRNRCDTLPGLTGLWQVSGKNRTTFVDMMRMDISYVRRKKWWFDLWMLGRTVPAVCSEIRSTVRASRRR